MMRRRDHQNCQTIPRMFLERMDVYLTLSIIDAVCWFAASFALVVFRYDFNLDAVQWSTILLYSVIAATTQMLLGWLAGVYGGANRIGSFVEASTLATVTMGVGFLVGMALRGWRSQLSARSRLPGAIHDASVHGRCSVCCQSRGRADRSAVEGLQQSGTHPVVWGG